MTPRSGPSRRATLAGPAVALVTLGAAAVVTAAVGVPIRDPGGVTVRRLVTAIALVAVLAALDVAVRALRAPRPRPSWRALVRARWSGRALPVAVALLSFYATYLGYRNLKSVVPLVEPGVSFDGRLGDVDSGLFGGRAPAQVLHDLLGTDAAAHVLSTAYMFFFAFIPLALALAVVLAPRVEAGLFVVTALALNWLVAAGSYYVLPSLGPIYADPAVFADLPATAVSALQADLLAGRSAFLADPEAPGAVQSIGAFASLHVSIHATTVALAHVLGAGRALKALLWLLLAATVLATVYFGWHYVLDDVAGVVIALVAVALARVLTGYERRRRRPRRVGAPAPEPA